MIRLKKAAGGTNVTYFYSPRTKSVVRIMADHRMRGITNNIDVYKSRVELIAYGNKSTGVARYGKGNNESQDVVKLPKEK